MYACYIFFSVFIICLVLINIRPVSIICEYITNNMNKSFKYVSEFYF